MDRLPYDLLLLDKAIVYFADSPKKMWGKRQIVAKLMELRLTKEDSKEPAQEDR